GLSATAGVVKIGSAAAAPIAKFTRWSKQKGRDIGAESLQNPQQGRFKKAMGKRAVKMFNTNKSTAEKQKQYVKDATEIVHMLVKLPPTVDDSSRPQYEAAYEV